jgi:hypothetical protein
MAVRWRLVDEDDNTFNLDSHIFLRNNDEFKLDIDLEPRTFEDGSIFSGKKRMEAKEMTFGFTKNFDNDSNYRDYFNQIIYQFRKAVKIRDIILDIEAVIDLSQFSISFATGSFLRVSDNEVTIILKDVFWLDVDYTEININGSAPSTSGSQAIVNSGWAPTKPIITLTANTGASIIFFVVDETNQGIKIYDLQFGNVGLTEYIINCEEGYISVGGIRRNENIQNGSGPFEFPVGNSTLTYDINGDVDIKIEYKNKVYL